MMGIFSEPHTYFGTNPEVFTCHNFLNLSWPNQGLVADSLILSRLLKKKSFSKLIIDVSFFRLAYRQQSRANDVNFDAYGIYYFNQKKIHFITFGISAISKRIKTYCLDKIINRNNLIRMNSKGFNYIRDTIQVDEFAVSDGIKHNNFWKQDHIINRN
jgi:hypothetical protein